jgi:hypothetical protein
MSRRFAFVIVCVVSALVALGGVASASAPKPPVGANRPTLIRNAKALKGAFGATPHERLTAGTPALRRLAEDAGRFLGEASRLRRRPTGFLATQAGDGTRPGRLRCPLARTASNLAPCRQTALPP